jgi:catechol 2,3-dioxygenase-like lactoylglutathione lyase family enzyme
MTERFRMGRLDHAHITVPNRDEAAAWYSEHLGFEPVEELRFWADAVDGGPLQISADGGRTTLALFEGSVAPAEMSNPPVAFSVDAESFIAFARSLPGVIENVDGAPLTLDDLVDFDLCWAFDLADPWGNRYELNCFDYEVVRAALVDGDGIRPQRKWPAELHQRWLRGQP